MDYEIDFEDVAPSLAMEAEIAAKVHHLKRLFPQSVACKVVVSRKYARAPDDYLAQIQLTVPRCGLSYGAPDF